jgi:hypothetical protein
MYNERSLQDNNRKNIIRPCTIWDSAVELVTRKALNLLRLSGSTKPPFLQEELAHFQRVESICREDLGELSGVLVPSERSFIIKLNATHSPQRQSYSCAHEIAHTFFIDDDGKRLYDELNKRYGEKIAKSKEEELCDIAASELLMPSPLFKKYAAYYNFDIRSLVHLSRIFNTSISSTALKLCELSPRACFVVYWTLNSPATFNDMSLQPSWLSWSKKRITSRTGKLIFKPKIIGDYPSILKAYRSEAPISAYHRLSVGNFYRGPCDVWSQGFEPEPYRYVISFIYPDRI